MKKFDVIIIGAGPAGLNCALTLAQVNKKVLLIEQNKIIGPKVCAGGLTGDDIRYLDLPVSLIDYKYKEIIFHTPFNDSSIKLDHYFVYTIDRKNLGQWQLKKLKKSTTQIKTGCRVSEIRKNHIVLENKEKIGFDFLVGADGSNSIVRRFLGLKTYYQDLAIQYIIKTKKYKKLEVFYDSSFFHSWYAWIFPHENYVSIGCCADPRYLSGQKLKDNFNQWLVNNKVDVSKGEYQAHTINFDYQGYKFGNIFLAGDAAGFASGFTGEGIYPALISGEEIAKLIIDQKYMPEKIKELIATKNTHNKILSVLEKSGPVREVEYESIALLLKTRLLNQKIAKVIA